MNAKWKIPYPHVSGAIADSQQEAPDHHPLTKEEIAALLDEAENSEGVLTAQILVRLHQGIPGIVCPRAIDGPVFNKENEISVLYTDNYHRGAVPELVERLYQIMMR